MWRRDPLLAAVLWWTALVAGVLVWLPLVRVPPRPPGPILAGSGSKERRWVSTCPLPSSDPLTLQRRGQL